MNVLVILPTTLGRVDGVAEVVFLINGFDKSLSGRLRAEEEKKHKITTYSIFILFDIVPFEVGLTSTSTCDGVKDGELLGRKGDISYVAYLPLLDDT